MTRLVYVVDTDLAATSATVRAINDAVEQTGATVAAIGQAPSPLDVSLMFEAAAGHPGARTPEAQHLATQLAAILEVADFEHLERALGTYVITLHGAPVASHLASYEAARTWLELRAGGADHALRNGYDILRPTL